MTSTLLGLSGRRALVTGAASGIGAAVATRLSEAGADVHLLDRDEEGVAKVAARVHGTAHVVDLTDEAAIGALDLDKATEDLVAAVAFLLDHPDSNEQIGCVGFCWGGGMANRLAVAAADLKASVAYYGKPLLPDQAAKVQAPLLLHYAGLDERINADVPAFDAALKENGKDYEIEFYEGVDHAFNNDTSAERYDKAAAELAWSRSMAFLKRELDA